MERPINENSHLGIIFGIICVALALLPWIPLDLYLKRKHDEYITTEVREALQGGGWPAIIFIFLVGGILAVGAFHFFYQRGLS